MSRTQQDPIIRISRPRRDVISRAVSGAILGGSLVAAAVMIWPSAPRDAGEQQAVIDQPIAVVSPPVSPPIAKQEPAPAPAETSSEPSEVKSARPVVALAHEDTETDFSKLAIERMDAGELGEALVALRKHLYRSEPTAEVLLNVGRLARQTGENALAEQALLDAAALDPKSGEVQVELARVLLDVGELSEARIHARQAIRLDMESALAWNVAGRIAMQQSEWARAEASLRRAVELEPMNAMFHNNLGLLYVYMRRADDAVDSLETAVELFDEEAPYFAFNNLGLAHELAGHLDEAREAFEQALVVNPTYSRARLNLERVSTALAKREETPVFDTASGPAPQEERGESLRP